MLKSKRCYNIRFYKLYNENDIKIIEFNYRKVKF